MWGVLSDPDCTFLTQLNLVATLSSQTFLQYRLSFIAFHHSVNKDENNPFGPGIDFVCVTIVSFKVAVSVSLSLTLLYILLSNLSKFSVSLSIAFEVT